MIRTDRRTVSAAAAAAVIMIASTLAIAQGFSLSKPLAQFTIGDIFPRVVDVRFREAGENWQRGADDLVSIAVSREASAKDALSVKKKEINQLERQLKAAKKDKDFVTAGTIEGRIKTEKIVMDVLDRLEDISEAQLKVAEAFRDTGNAIQAFVDSDEAFDGYRDLGITRPEPGEVDRRLEGPGYRSFLRHVAALDDLGKSFEHLGEELDDLAKTREKVLEALEAGGHVVKPAK